MTKAKALAKAKQRWGPYAVVLNTQAMLWWEWGKGSRLVGKKPPKKPLTIFGSGNTWEAAFADTKRHKQPKRNTS